jgi:chromosome partitioning protein
MKDVVSGKKEIAATAEVVATSKPKNILRKAQVWAIPARKGGVLKTSLIVNLAGALASKGKKVAIVDLDSQGNSIVAFGGNPDVIEYTVYDLLTIKNASVQPSIQSVYKNIDIIPANEKMDDLDFEVIPNREKYPFPFTLLRDALHGIRCDYDYILIDTPPNSVLIQSNALMFADKVIIPYQPESFSMRSLVKTVAAVNKFKEKHNPNLKLLGVVATLVDNRTNVHIEILNETRRYCRKKKIPIFNTIIPRLTRGAADIAYNRLPTTIASPKDRLSEHYFDLLEEVEDLG